MLISEACMRWVRLRENWELREVRKAALYMKAAGTDTQQHQMWGMSDDFINCFSVFCDSVLYYCFDVSPLCCLLLFSNGGQKKVSEHSLQSILPTCSLKAFPLYWLLQTLS